MTLRTVSAKELIAEGFADEEYNYALLKELTERMAIIDKLLTEALQRANSYKK